MNYLVILPNHLLAVELMMQGFSSTAVKVTVLNHLQMMTVTIWKEMELVSELLSEK